MTDDHTLRRQTNRGQLQQIITGLTEGVILVEPDGAIVWANEAALRVHGVDAVAGLGADADAYRERFVLRYRNNHLLQAGQYPMDRVIAGETFSDVVVEVVPAADVDARWVHRIRSLVLTDVDGEPDCLVLIVADVTDWASAEQRFEKTFNANPAPAVICRLDDLRYIKVNQGFMEMTGYGRDDVIGKSVYELDVFERADARKTAIEKLGEGVTISQMQAELTLPDGGSKLVIVAGQPIEIGEQACMLFSFMDLEPRRKAEDALRQSEERFAKAFRMTPVPTLVCSAGALRVVEANEAFVATTGFASEELLGRSLDEIGLLEEGGAHARIGDALRDGGALRSTEFRIHRKTGEVLDCLLSAESFSIHDQPCHLMALLDITDRKRSEMELVGAIETVMQDASWFSQTLIEKLANVRRGNGSGAAVVALADLTARERDALGLVCDGLSDKEIATRLGLATNTVRNHVASLYSKLDVHSRSEAIVWARERGFFGSGTGAAASGSATRVSGPPPKSG